MYSSNKSVKNYEEEILQKMQVGNVMPEKGLDVSFLQCRTSSDCFLGKHEIPADVTSGGDSFISKGETSIGLPYNCIAIILDIFCDREEHAVDGSARSCLFEGAWRKESTSVVAVLFP